MITTNDYSLRIAWLYPDLMSTYGDRGNIIVLQKRCEWRGVSVEVVPISTGANSQQLRTTDIILMGGAEDKQQKIVAEDLKGEKEKMLREKIEAGTPGLFVCGAYQFLGKYYKEADGTMIDGLGILDIYTEHPGNNNQRLIGNIAVQASLPTTNDQRLTTTLIGFENHGGRTYIGKEVLPLGKVLAGSGNNGKDGTEGAIYKNTIDTYLHGPILPKNPDLADWLIQKALGIKYKKDIVLEPLDDQMERQARGMMLKKLKSS